MKSINQYIVHYTAALGVYKGPLAVCIYGCARGCVLSAPCGEKGLRNAGRGGGRG